jgi:FkbM family methyltransferase
MVLLSQIRLHLKSVRVGDRLADRAAILCLVALRALTPIWRLFNRLHVDIPSPLLLIRRYRIRAGVNRWEVSGNEGAAYLFPGTALGAAFEEVERGLNGVCIDVGASFGWFTVRWARQVGTRGRVLALEPDPRHYPSLVRNVELNQLTNVIALTCAAGDRDGVLDLFAPEFALTIFDASAVRHEGGAAIQVPMRTIDGLCDELSLTDVRLVKIDVEGFEPNVLRGMKRLLEHDHPTVIFEAWTADLLSACRAELPSNYHIRPLSEWDYVAEPRVHEAPG